MKRYIYLIQGEASRVKKFFGIRKRRDVDAVYITYDQEIDNAIYFPNSTWGEGRNLLLEKALESGHEYEYYIFLDDDVRFMQGSCELFEKQLAKYRPAIAVPVFFPKTMDCVLGVGVSFRSRFFIPIFNYQLCRFADAQYMAFHKKVVFDQLVVPLQTHFDPISWWCTSSTQQLLNFNLYGDLILQFNNVVVANDAHRDYYKNEFQKIQNEWLARQFIGPVSDPRQASINLLAFNVLRRNFRKKPPRHILRIWREFMYIFYKTLTYRFRRHEPLTEKQVLRLLKPDSDLLAQCRSTYAMRTKASRASK